MYLVVGSTPSRPYHRLIVIYPSTGSTDVPYSQALHYTLLLYVHIFKNNSCNDWSVITHYNCLSNLYTQWHLLTAGLKFYWDTNRGDMIFTEQWNSSTTVCSVSCTQCLWCQQVTLTTCQLSGGPWCCQCHNAGVTNTEQANFLNYAPTEGD